MIGFGLLAFVRFLLGILLLQGVTGLLVYIALGTDWHSTWPLYAALAGAVGVMVAVLFTAMSGSDRRHAVARAGVRFSKEREQIRVKAEQQRSKDIRNQERLAAKAARRGVGTGMTLKSGLAVGGVVGVGVAMVLTQFVTLGLVTLTTAGGAMLGYGVRARQERMIAARRLAAEEKRLKVIEAREAPAQIELETKRARLPKDLKS